MTSAVPLASMTNLRAPFAPGGPFELDSERCRKLLEIALRRGGEFADIYAEFAVGGSMVLDEGIIKTASRGVSLGVGVRVRRGEAAGYAYSEDLSWEALVRAAETAAQITDGKPAAPVEISERKHRRDISSSRRRWPRVGSPSANCCCAQTGRRGLPMHG